MEKIGPSRRVFSNNHLMRLERLGLDRQQIEELECTIPELRAHFRGPAALTDVRTELDAVIRQLRDADTAIAQLLCPRIRRIERQEVLVRIWNSLRREGYPDELFLQTKRGLEAVLAASTNARAALPITQRREISKPWAVKQIHWTLLVGWTQRCRRQRRRSVTGLDSYPYPPSASVTSPFYEIVTICFSCASGKRKEANASRSIRAFMREHKDMIDRDMAALGAARRKRKGTNMKN